MALALAHPRRRVGGRPDAGRGPGIGHGPVDRAQRDRSTRRPRSGSARRSTRRPTTTRRWRSSGSTRPAGSTSRCATIVKDILDAPMPVVVYVSPERRARRLGGRVHHRGRPTWRRWRRRPTSARRARYLDRRRHRRHASGRRSRTTPRPSSARSRSPTAATATLPGEMVTDARNVTATEALRRQRDRRDRLRPGRPAHPARRLRGQGPEGDHARTPRGCRSTSATSRSATSCSQLLVNPTIAFLLLSLGLVGIAIEIFSPGLIFPGAARRGRRCCSAPTAAPSCR